jgi:hypothetical protein
MKQKFFATLLGGFLALGCTPNVFGDDGQGSDEGKSIRHVLLISIDGMHAVDLYNCVHGISGINGGLQYCPSLAGLASTGANFTEASTSKPSDSFPGILALVAGASPRSAGVYYDVSYTRELAPPAVFPSVGTCVAGTPGPGTAMVYDETLDFSLGDLTGGGGINPDKLALDPMHGCAKVYPRNFVRVNTIFGVLHSHHRYTAWSDKHPAYDVVRGRTPSGAVNNSVDDLNSPEINSIVVPVAPGVAGFPSCNPIRDTSDTSAWTNSFQNIQCYDLLKVKILLNEIDGMKSDGSGPAPVPAVFGMNFQAVSVGEKLIDANAVIGGYVNPISDPLGPLGKPSPSLYSEITFVDAAIGKLVNELKLKGLDQSTMIIISAKHGQSPIDLSRWTPINTALGRPTKLLSSLVAGASEDDVSLLWLKHSTDTITAVTMLEANEAAAGIGEIFAGPSMKVLFGDPTVDPRVPDIAVQPNVGVIYTGNTSKVAEHGGFAHDDTNVMLLVSNPQMSPATVTTPVETAQIAPTIVKVLGYDPNELDAVQLEHTQVLPGVRFPD